MRWNFDVMRIHLRRVPISALLAGLFAAVVQAKEISEPQIHLPDKHGLYSHFLSAVLLERRGDYFNALKEYNKTLELDPTATLVYQLRSTLHLKMGKPEKALSDAQSYVKAQPEDLGGLLLLSQLHLLLGQRTAAQLILEKILALNPEHAEALLSLAALLISSEPKRAAELYEKLLRIEPQNAEATYHLGLIYQNSNQTEKAKEMFKKVIELDPSSLPALVLLGQMHEAEEKIKSAVEYYESALEKIPDNDVLRLKLILLYAKEGNLKKMEELLQPYANDPHAPTEMLLWLGILAEAKKDWKKSLGYYLKARQEVNSPEIKVRLASIYSQTGELKKALKVIRELTRKFPNEAQYRYLLGLAYLDVKNPRRASREFQLATELKKDFVSAYFQAGVALDLLKQWQEAEKKFQYVIQLDTQHAAAYNYLGYSYADKNEKEKFFEARKLLEKALLLDPENAAYLDSIGWLEYREGNFKDALNFLKSAAEKMPDAVILEHLGDCYLALKNFSEAASSYSHSLELEPNNKAVTRKLKKLYRRVIPGSPARALLKKFELNLAKAKNISGLLLLKGKNAIPGFIQREAIQGFFYLRTAFLSSSSTQTPNTELRLDLGVAPLAPPVTLLLQNYPKDSWQVFPPEYKEEISEQTEPAIGSILSFLNGTQLKEFDDPETTVQEKGNSFLLTKNNLTLKLDKKSGIVSEISGNGFHLKIDKYQKIGELLFPQKITFLPERTHRKASLAARLCIEFSHLSLEKIDNKLFEIGSPR